MCLYHADQVLVIRVHPDGGVNFAIDDTQRSFLYETNMSLERNGSD
jgi:hypothetical protein